MSETVNQSTRQARCAHPLCKCTVPAGKRFCSDHCQKASERPSRAEGSKCGCGHAACDETVG